MGWQIGMVANAVIGVVYFLIASWSCIPTWCCSTWRCR